jgi:chromate transporter
MEPSPDAQPAALLPAARPASLSALALLFLRLGLTAFGGPAAHIAMMQAEVVEQRQWLTKEEFLDLIGAANLIPGPSSTEVAIYIGYRQAGWKGLVLAGTCFILPAFLMVMGIAWAYVQLGQQPQLAGALYGIKPVVIAVVAQALWNLGRTALKTRPLAGIGLAALVLAFCRVNPLLLLLGAGALVGGRQWVMQPRESSVKPLLTFLLPVLISLAVAAGLRRVPGVSVPPGLQPIFLVFLKLGAVVYGSGYVLLAFLRADLVLQRGWLTSAQLLDAVAVGQLTPGPVFTTATFIGYVLAGPKGAVAATVGIFLPAFLLAGVTGPLLPRLRQSALTGAFLDGVNVAALALMAVVAWQLGGAALRDPLTIALAAGSTVLLLRYRVNSAWLILGGAVIGAASFWLK